jgi:hypothetical protein
VRQVGDLFELNVKLRCQKFNEGGTLVATARSILINLQQEDTKVGSTNSLMTQFPVLH